MRLKLDDNLSRSAAKLCRAAGHDVTTFVIRHSEARPTNRYSVSAQEGRVLIALDRDLSQVLPRIHLSKDG
jgi:Domain of unknown function (DUF5615)